MIVYVRIRSKDELRALPNELSQPSTAPPALLSFDLCFEDAAAADTAGSTLVRKRRLLEDDDDLVVVETNTRYFANSPAFLGLNSIADGPDKPL